MYGAYPIFFPYYDSPSSMWIYADAYGALGERKGADRNCKMRQKDTYGI